MRIFNLHFLCFTPGKIIDFVRVTNVVFVLRTYPAYQLSNVKKYKDMICYFLCIFISDIGNFKQIDKHAKFRMVQEFLQERMPKFANNDMATIGKVQL